MSKEEALKMAIAFMETLTIDTGIKTWNEKHRKEALNACKEVLEQPAQEPLSDDEIDKILDNDDLWKVEGDEVYVRTTEFARAIEQAHGIGVKDGTPD